MHPVPDLVLLSFSHLWVYIAGPLIGATVAVVLIVALGILLLGFSRLVQSNRLEAKYRRCPMNLAHIGQACLLYSIDHKNAFPPDFGTLIKTEDINVDAFVCPFDTVVIPAGMTKDQAAVWVDQNSSYIYSGAGLTQDCDPSIVVVYEKDSNHGTGMNLLFADGHVEFDNLAEAHEAIKKGKLKRK